MGRMVLPGIMKERFKKWQYPEIEEGKLTKYNWMVQNKDSLKIGHKTDIGAFTYINAKNGVVIEDFVQVGSHCSLYSISTIDNKEGQITLKKNCKIGSHSLIMPGVTVGENAVIGAFSFVNKDVPSNVVAAGIPVKVIKKIEGE
jgi:acetyltransferase-like isoleucine patch superfamily enzyme